MATIVQPRRDALTPRDGLVQREGLRVIRALAALLAAALVMAGGLLWREHARAQDRVHAVSTSAAR